MDKSAKIKELENSIEIYMKHTTALEEEIQQLQNKLIGSKEIAWQIIEAENLVIFRDGSMGKLTPGKMVCRLAGD